MDAGTKTYCILGNPISHSLSPVMQNAAFKAMDINSVYTAYSVIESDLEKAVNGIRALGIAGASVTIPYKEKIIPFLDGITDIARSIGSVVSSRTLLMPAAAASIRPWARRSSAMPG